MPAGNTQTVLALVQANRIAEAKTLCKSLCDSDPRDMYAWFLLGIIHAQLHEYVEAEACCRRVVAANPQEPMPHFNLGVALLQQERFAEAASLSLIHI